MKNKNKKTKNTQIGHHTLRVIVKWPTVGCRRPCKAVLCCQWGWGGGIRQEAKRAVNPLPDIDFCHKITCGKSRCRAKARRSIFSSYIILPSPNGEWGSPHDLHSTQQRRKGSSQVRFLKKNLFFTNICLHLDYEYHHHTQPR